MKAKNWIERSVDAIIEDFSGRLRTAWNSYDEGTLEEVKEVWMDIIAGYYASKNDVINDEPLIDEDECSDGC